jgi:hypothetical protein
MAARKQKSRRRKAAPGRRAAGHVGTSNLALHDLFARQAAAILENADLSEEDKQSILVAMNCPCCGTGGMSFTVKLRPAPRFAADDGEKS